MSKNSIIPFLKDYLINFLTSPFLLDTNDSESIHVLNIKFKICFLQNEQTKKQESVTINIGLKICFLTDLQAGAVHLCIGQLR